MSWKGDRLSIWDGSIITYHDLKTRREVMIPSSDLCRLEALVNTFRLRWVMILIAVNFVISGSKAILFDLLINNCSWLIWIKRKMFDCIYLYVICIFKYNSKNKNFWIKTNNLTLGVHILLWKYFWLLCFPTALLVTGADYTKLIIRKRHPL